MIFKEYKKMICNSWEEWARSPATFIRTLNELFADNFDDCIVYPKDIFQNSESPIRMFFIFSPQKLYIIEHENAFHEIKSFKYNEVNYIVKREADYSIQVDLIINDNSIQLNPLTDSNTHWEYKFNKYIIDIIKFLEKQ